MTQEKDFIDLGTKLPIQVFIKRLEQETRTFKLAYKPYDEPCAIFDFHDMMESVQKENERKHGYVKPGEIKVDLDNFDFSKYGDEDRFILEEDQEDVTEKFIQGTRTKVILGHTLSYRCKTRGHGLAVFVPMADYEKMSFSKNKVKKPKEVDDDKGNVDLVSDKK